ncbi:ABHDD-like protein [Mya arenaria]|uniref:ABHDD-like protein n=1 Tax=Mya arenaria TaxID=6604 RepID=A0ABY7F5U7_MYAAR|nr:ABHDD-like protein [Mya arenaria]
MTEKKSKLNKDQIQQENETVLIEKMSRSALYRTCQIVCRLAHMIIARFWKLCSSACLVILLVSFTMHKICSCTILASLQIHGYLSNNLTDLNCHLIMCLSKPKMGCRLYIDARTALEWLLTKPGVDRKKIFVFGSSLGGAVSIQLASDPRYSPDIAGLILENTFTSLPDVINQPMKKPETTEVPMEIPDSSVI